MAKLSWLWKIAAVIMGVAALVGGIMVLSKAAAKRVDDFCWPNNAEFKKSNDEAWQKVNI